MTEPMSTPDSGGLREAVEALAEAQGLIVHVGMDPDFGDMSSGLTGAQEQASRLVSKADRILTSLLAAHPEPVPTPDSADDATVGERIHWIGEHRNTLHGNGAGSKGMERVSGDEDEVTCSLCLSLLAREDVRERIELATPPADDANRAPVSGGLDEGERADMHMALSDSYDDLDEFVHTLIADRVAAARADERERAARILLALLRPPAQAERAALIVRKGGSL